MGTERSLPLLLLLLIIHISSAAFLPTQHTSSGRDQNLRQSPWPAGDLQGQWRQQQRALLQNPDRPPVDWNGRKGGIESESKIQLQVQLHACCCVQTSDWLSCMVLYRQHVQVTSHQAIPWKPTEL